MSTETLRFQVIKSQDRSEQKYLEILELCSQAYQRDFKILLETFCNATHILGRINNMLVVHALWVTRWLQSATIPPLRTAYVEAVATEESYRGRGFATAIMRRIAKEIKHFDLGALSPGVPDLYARLGWQLWRGPLFIRTNEGLVPTPNEQVMVLLLPNTPVLDLTSALSAEWREGEPW